jgi:uncharacterized protein (DUF1800 family)
MLLRLARIRTGLLASSIVLAVSVWTGCGAMSGSGGSGQSGPSMTLAPDAAEVRIGDTLQFSATETGVSSALNSMQAPTITWSVNGIPGGNTTIGKITAKGLYTAPATLPSPNSISVEATDAANKLVGQSQLTLQNAVPVLSKVTPDTVGIGSFSITVTGSKFVKGAKVMFGGQELAAKFVSATQLTATGTSTTAQKGTVAVTVMNPDPGGAASNAFSLRVGLTPISIAMTPTQASVPIGRTQQFTAKVTGATNAAVKWAVNGTAGGNSTVGTISAAGLYAAPKAVPSPAKVTISATSAEDANISASAAVTVQSGLPVLSSVFPLSLPVGDFSMSVSGQNFLSGAQVMFNGTFLTTTFISATQLSATGTAGAAGTFPVQVINPGSGSPTSNAIQVQVGGGTSSVSASAAARLLEQSTFGPTPQLIQHVQQVGMQAFLNEQFKATASTYATPAADADIRVVQNRFFVNALNGQDQLRQRVAFALSQIMVISNQKIGNPSAFTLWMNMMQKDAFGNFSTLLTDVTLSPSMGNYLDMVNNDKPDPNSGTTPNENYAREVLQLFSIGLNQLNQDGTVQLDGNGNPIPTYTQDTIEGFAHVFTGWSYPPKPGASAKFWSGEYYGGPMVSFDNHHDTGEKILLSGVTLPAGGTAQSDLTAAMQNIFNHPNVGPFIGKQLIQHLVTSNPSPEYVGRVSAVFADNGSGVRGDLKAVVTAILMDPEARRGDDPAQVVASDGHLKEPLLFMLNLLRATRSTSDGANLNYYASDMRQEPFESTTVFNFYPPNYLIPNTNLLGPEFKIFNSSTTISRINFVNDLVYGSVSSTTKTDLSPYVGIAGNPAELVDTLGGVLLHGQMSDSMRTTILNAITPITDTTSRAKSAMYLIGSSSQFQVEH